MTSWRELIAHAFTPWAWRSRGSVMALVAVAVAVLVLGPVLVLTNGIAAPAKAGNIIVGEVVAYFLFLRPARRSLQRWDTARSAEGSG